MLLQSPNLEIEKKFKNKQQSFSHATVKYLKLYSYYTYHKEQKQLVEKQSFNKVLIDNFYKLYINQYDIINDRKKVILGLYNEYIQTSNNKMQIYQCYQFIQYLMVISDKKFSEEFNTHDICNLNDIISVFKLEYITTLHDLKLKVAIAKHLQYNQMNIWLDNAFKIQDIPKNTILNMLDNIENRLLIISGGQFLIARRVSDNQIFSTMIMRNNIQQINQLLFQCNDGQLYDIIIRSRYDHQCVGNIKVRYLNYHYNDLNETIDIELKNPYDLITLSLVQVKITNLSQCVNLKNLCTCGNICKNDALEYLTNIKRIYRINERFVNDDKALLQCLFKNNQLQFLHIDNNRYCPTSIAKPFILSQNTQNLLYIDVRDLKILIKSLGSSIDGLFKIFIQTYVTQNSEFRNSDFCNIKWVEQQIGTEQCIKYRVLNLKDNMLDHDYYKNRLFDVVISEADSQQKEVKLNELASDVKQYMEALQMSNNQLLNQVDNNIQFFIKYMLFCKNMESDQAKVQCIEQLYEYVDSDVNKKYEIFKLVKYFMSISNQQFIDEFEIKTDEDVRQLVRNISQNKVKSEHYFKLMTQMSKYLEYKEIQLKCNENFSLSQISDQLIARLFCNITQRIQLIQLPVNYVIIHRVSDGKIFKSQLSLNNYAELEELFLKYDNKETYDIIIRTNIKYKNLQSIRIRYLNCISNDQTITLKYPEQLITAAMSSTKINNLNQCNNLRNLFSYKNIYTQTDVQNLNNLKRIYIRFSKYYELGTCLIQKLLNQNTLEYIRTDNGRKYNNIISSIILDKNIRKLRYLYINQRNVQYQIKINVSKEFPYNLLVFYAQFMMKKQYFFLKISNSEGICGTQEQVRRLQSQLIHQLPQSQ